VRLDQVATAAAAPKKQPNIFAAFGAKVPAKKSKEIELREKKDNAALFSPGVRLYSLIYSASLPASSKKRKHELGINARTNPTGLRMPIILGSPWLSTKRSRAPVAGRWPLLLLFYAQARLCPVGPGGGGRGS
jgi:hypothetical protein